MPLTDNKASYLHIMQNTHSRAADLPAATLNRDVVAFIVTFTLQIPSLFWHVKEIFIKIVPNRENRPMGAWLAHTI